MDNLVKFIEDAFFLESAIFRLNAQKNALNNLKEESLKRQEYQMNTDFWDSMNGRVLILIGMVVPIGIGALVLTPFFAFLLYLLAVPFKWWKLFLILWCIGNLVDIIANAPEIIRCIIGKRREMKAYVEVYTQEEERLEHVNEVVVPKIEKELYEIQLELATLESELCELYELELLPEEFCNFEYMSVLNRYATKYKVTDKKGLLNACDRYYKAKDLSQDVERARDSLHQAEFAIVQEFEEMVSSVLFETETMAQEIVSQNYDIMRLEERTERNRRNTELLLYWKMSGE